MIVFCEECGTKNIIDPAQARQQQDPIRCRECNDMLRYTLPAPEKAKLKRAKPEKAEPERVKPEQINKKLPGTPRPAAPGVTPWAPTDCHEQRPADRNDGKAAP